MKLVLLLCCFCTIPAHASVYTPTNYSLNGVIFYSDASMQAKVDLDVRSIAQALRNPYWESTVVPPGAIQFDVAQTIYTSTASSGRTLQSLSTQPEPGQLIEPTMQRYIQYYGSRTYADDFVSAAFASGLNMIPTARAQFIQTAIVVLHIYMTVVHELNEGYINCLSFVPFAKGDQSSSPIEESWSYYSGSLEGPYRDYTHNGYLLFALADSLCPFFSKCIPSGKMSMINSRNLAVFQEAQSSAMDGNCVLLSSGVSEIQQQLRTVLVQGLIGHLWEADTSSSYTGSVTANRDVEKAELWAYTLALLPEINSCSPSLAAQLRVLTNASAPQPYSSATVIAQVLAQLPCLGVLCADVGTLNALPSSGCSDAPVTAMPTVPPTACPAPPSQSGLVAAIIILVVGELTLVYYFCIHKRTGQLRASHDEFHGFAGTTELQTV